MINPRGERVLVYPDKVASLLTEGWQKAASNDRAVANTPGKQVNQRMSKTLTTRTMNT